jgi:hypothetical protein
VLVLLRRQVTQIKGGASPVYREHDGLVVKAKDRFDKDTGSHQVYVPSRQISGRSIKMHSDTSGKLLAEFSSDFWPTFLSFIRQVSEKLGADCEKRIPRRLDRC